MLQINADDVKAEWNLNEALIYIPMIDGEGDKFCRNAITLNSLDGGDQAILTNTGLENSFLIGLDKNLFESYSGKSDLLIIQNPETNSQVAYAVSFVEQDRNEIEWENVQDRDKIRTDWCTVDKPISQIKDVFGYDDSIQILEKNDEPISLDVVSENLDPQKIEDVILLDNTINHRKNGIVDPESQFMADYYSQECRNILPNVSVIMPRILENTEKSIIVNNKHLLKNKLLCNQEFSENNSVIQNKVIHRKLESYPSDLKIIETNDENELNTSSIIDSHIKSNTPSSFNHIKSTTPFTLGNHIKSTTPSFVNHNIKNNSSSVDYHIEPKTLSTLASHKSNTLTIVNHIESNTPSSFNYHIETDTPSSLVNEMETDVPSSVANEIESDTPYSFPNQIEPNTPYIFIDHTSLKTNLMNHIKSNEPFNFVAQMESDTPTSLENHIEPKTLSALVNCTKSSNLSYVASHIQSDTFPSVVNKIESNTGIDLANHIKSNTFIIADNIESNTPSSLANHIESNTPSSFVNHIVLNTPCNLATKIESKTPSSINNHITSFDIPDLIESNTPSSLVTYTESNTPSSIDNRINLDTSSSLAIKVDSNPPCSTVNYIESIPAISHSNKNAQYDTVIKKRDSDLLQVDVKHTKEFNGTPFGSNGISSYLPEKSLPLKKKAKMKGTVIKNGCESFKCRQECDGGLQQEIKDSAIKEDAKPPSQLSHQDESSDSDEPLSNLKKKLKLTKAKEKNYSKEKNLVSGRENVGSDQESSSSVCTDKSDEEKEAEKEPENKSFFGLDKTQFKTIRELVEGLKSSRIISEPVWEILDSGLKEMKVDILEEMNREKDMEAAKNGDSYSARLKAFALILFFKQPSAFHILANIYQNAWPSLKVVKEWKRRVNNRPRRFFMGSSA